MSEERILNTQGVATLDVECTHHWVIETPSGPVSHGACKLCGQEREFKNYLENTPYWEDDVYLNQVTSGARFRTTEADVDSPDGSED